MPDPVRLLPRWLPIPGYEGFYEVSDSGAVRSLYSGKLLTLRPNAKGYLRACLSVKGVNREIAVHKLVCLAFHGPAPEGREVGHLNGTKTDNRPENVAWITRSENAHQKVDHGRHPRVRLAGAANGRAKLTAEQVREIRSSSLSTTALGRKFGVSSSTVWEARNGTSWREDA